MRFAINSIEPLNSKKPSIETNCSCRYQCIILHAYLIGDSQFSDRLVNIDGF